MTHQGKLIKKYRLAKGLTQKEAANFIFGSSVTNEFSQQISNCERGVCFVPKARIKDFCRILGIPSDVFMSAYIKDVKSRLCP